MRPFLQTTVYTGTAQLKRSRDTSAESVFIIANNDEPIAIRHPSFPWGHCFGAG